MDELHTYHQSKMSDIDKLPSTSYAIDGHLLHSLYITYKQMHCIGEHEMEPKKYGFADIDGMVQPLPMTRM